MTEKRDFVTRVAQGDYHKTMTDRFGVRYLQYRDDWEASGRGQRILPFPLQIDFEVIDYCNLKCIMCTRSTDRGTKVRLPMSTFRKVIDEGAGHGLSAVELGARAEPLLHASLPDMIAYASSSGIMDIRVHTNATVLTRNLSSRLIQNGLTKMSFSLDACTPETYRQIRGGDLQQVARNVIAFLDELRVTKRGLPVTSVSLVEMPQNASEVQDFIGKWGELVDFVDIQNYGDQSDLSKDVAITSADVDGFCCYQPWSRITVSANGDINPCCSFRGRTLVMGNVRDQSIAGAWNSPAMSAFRESLVRRNPPHVCLACYASRARPLTEVAA